MRYWNQDCFEDLERLAKAAEKQGFPGLAEYCRLRGRGLRRQAFEVLRNFIDLQRALPSGEARAVADRIMTLQQDYPSAALLTHPLWQGFLKPVLEDWKLHSDATTPRRWLALYNDDPELMREVLGMDPSDVPVRVALTRWLLASVDYATHHLVEGKFIGPEEETHVYLGEIAQHLREMPAIPAKKEIEHAHRDLSRLIADWQEFSRSGSGDFRRWCEARGHHHAWYCIIYYGR